jgi:hypothetical protein
VKRLFQSVSLLLVALWLPATLHCDLETASLWFDHGEHDDAVCCTPSMGCTHDGCETLEGGALKPADAFMRAPQPVPFLCFGLICQIPSLPVALMTPVVVHTGDGEALNWMPDRHFARRTAPVSRAPSRPLC